MNLFVVGGQIYPEGAESLNLKTFEKLRVGQDKQWVKFPDLTVARRQLGCAVVRNDAGELGVVVVGGTGDAKEAETAVEFYRLEQGPGGSWERWPDIKTPRCCWPQVTPLTTASLLFSSDRLGSWRTQLLPLAGRRDHPIPSRSLIPR